MVFGLVRKRARRRVGSAGACVGLGPRVARRLLGRHRGVVPFGRSLLQPPGGPVLQRRVPGLPAPRSAVSSSRPRRCPFGPCPRSGAERSERLNGHRRSDANGVLFGSCPRRRGFAGRLEPVSAVAPGAGGAPGIRWARGKFILGVGGGILGGTGSVRSWIGARRQAARGLQGSAFAGGFRDVRPAARLAQGGGRARGRSGLCRADERAVGGHCHEAPGPSGGAEGNRRPRRRQGGEIRGGGAGRGGVVQNPKPGRHGGRPSRGPRGFWRPTSVSAVPENSARR